MEKRRVIFLVLALVWMAFIFLKSSKVADESSKESAAFITTIARVAVDGFDEMSKETRDALVERFDHPVRKAAHMAEYALLAFLLYGALFDIRYCWGVSFAVSVIYAISDEFHQTFVEGRSGEIRDVCIDAAGALIGLMIASAIFFYVKRVSMNRE